MALYFISLLILSLFFHCASAQSSFHDSSFQVENCTLPSSKWETLHYCQIATQPQKYQKSCLPKRLYPLLNQGEKVKGLIVMYHGFTGCPDTFTEISKVMVESGFVVLVPLLPGMGVNRGYNCNSAPNQCVSHGTNPSEIPISKEEYFRWTRNILEIVREESEFISLDQRDEKFAIMALGLSLGGTLAMYATEVKNSPFSKIVVANPYLSTSSPQLENYISRCTLQTDPQYCITSTLLKQLEKPSLNSFPIESKMIINGTDSFLSVPLYPLIKGASIVTKDLTVWSVKNGVGRIRTDSFDGFYSSIWKLLSAVGDSSTLIAHSIFDTEMNWGESCFKNNARGGICAFRMKHVIALQSFVEYVVGNLDSIPKSIHYGNIHSDVDGISRDSISFAVYNSLEQRGVSVSRCRFQHTCDVNQLIRSQNEGNNQCGAPHSCFSSAEGRFTSPHELYWQQSLLDAVSLFLNSSGNSIGVTEGNRNMCVTSTTNSIMGEQFDAIGIQYLEMAKQRYSVSLSRESGFQ